MSEQKQRRALIEYAVFKPFVNAAALGLAIAGPASFSGRFWEGLVTGFSGWLLFYLYRDNTSAAPPRRRPRRTIKASAGNKSKNISFDYQPAYITRQPLAVDILRAIFPKRARAPRAKPLPPIEREFIFHSHCNGSPVDLPESVVMQFIATAIRHRANGRGLGERYWVRECNLRPDWYQGFGPPGYRAFRNLLDTAENTCKIQLIIEIGHQKIGLVKSERETYRWLYRAERMK